MLWRRQDATVKDQLASILFSLLQFLSPLLGVATLKGLRIRRETKRLIEADLEKVNKKDFGRRIRTEDYLTLALSLVTPQHIDKLREASLTNADRLERDYRTYITKHGPISRDEYLGKRLSGEIPTSADDKDCEVMV
jgi:hypothetical protein